MRTVLQVFSWILALFAYSMVFSLVNANGEPPALAGTKPVKRPTQTELDSQKMQGIWICVRGEFFGAEDEEAIGHFIVVKGNSFIVRDQDGFESKATFKLDANQKPKQLIVTYPPEKPGVRGEILREIYKFQDGVLVTAGGYNGDPAPKVFRSTKEDHIGVCSYRRYKQEVHRKVDNQ